MTSILDTTLSTISGPRATLVAALTAADAVAPATTARPILTNVELRPMAGGVVVSASDGQVGLRVQAAGMTVSGTEPALVSAKRLRQVLAASGAEAVTMSLEGREDGRGLHIALSDGDFTLPSVVGEEFPSATGMPTDGGLFTLPGQALAALFDRVAFARDLDRASAILTGVLVEVSAGRVRVAATDGKVLAESQVHDAGIAAPGGEGVVRSAVLPGGTVALICRLAALVEVERMELGLPGKVAVVRITAKDLVIDLTSRVIEGAFPNYQAALVIPHECPEVMVPRIALTDALKRLSLLMDGRSAGTVLIFEADGLRVSPLSSSHGTGTIGVACQYAGERRRLGVNATYLLDILRHHSAESVRICFSRGLIMPDGHTTNLLMPIALPA